MRYYHYGYTTSDKTEVKKTDTISSIGRNYAKKQYNAREKSSDGLIIEDDTIYEIDDECINCRKNRDK